MDDGHEEQALGRAMDDALVRGNAAELAMGATGRTEQQAVGQKEQTTAARGRMRRRRQRLIYPPPMDDGSNLSRDLEEQRLGHAVHEALVSDGAAELGIGHRRTSATA